MNKLIKSEELVSIKKNNVVCSSIQVAKDFEKPHKDVLKKIDNILRKNSAKNFALLHMFKLSKYKSENGFQKCYLMNRDGFSLLVMRFTGDKALEWQIKYINAFNKMEKIIQEKQTPEWQQLRLTAKTSTKTLHDDIHDKFIPYAIEKGSKTYAAKPTLAYTHFDKPINKALGINKNDREQLDTIKQNLLDIMNKSCSCIINMEINKETDYHDIVTISKDKLTKIANIFES